MLFLSRRAECAPHTQTHARTPFGGLCSQVGILEGRKQSLVLTCRDLDVRMGEKRENIGDAGLSTESDETIENNLKDFDAKLAACVSAFFAAFFFFF